MQLQHLLKAVALLIFLLLQLPAFLLKGGLGINSRDWRGEVCYAFEGDAAL